MRSQHWLDNSLVPFDNKPLIKPILTKVNVALFRHYDKNSSDSMITTITEVKQSDKGYGSA